MVFANGVESPMFEAEGANSGSRIDSLQSFEIDTTEEIRYIRFAVKYGVYYNAMWLLDDDVGTIKKKVWRSSGSWTHKQKIPPG